MSTFRWVTTHYSFATGWAFGVQEVDLVNGQQVNERTVASGFGYEDIGSARSEGNRIAGEMDEAERIAADREEARSKYERFHAANDQNAMRLQQAAQGGL